MAQRAPPWEHVMIKGGVRYRLVELKVDLDNIQTEMILTAMLS